MSQKQVTHIGIDYGSKLAGTTVICYSNSKDGVQVIQSLKKQDADAWILNFVDRNPIDYVFLDAPLSLPKVYTKPAEEGDYFYRAADKISKAMSPMFLGGLTARAMKLQAQLNEKRITTIETYPKLLVKQLGLEEYYKSDLSEYQSQFLSRTNLELVSKIKNWHQADALLAYVSGLRFANDEHIEIGDKFEGTINY